MYRVLIVEDEEIIRRGLKGQINWNEAGFQVIGEADNGKSALELIPLLKPDVVFTDVKMPIMDGIELMSHLKSNNPEIRIVILSGYKEFEYARKAVEYGANAYLLKPTKSSEVMKTFIKIRNELDFIWKSKYEMESLKKKTHEEIPAIKGMLLSDISECRNTVNSIESNRSQLSNEEEYQAFNEITKSVFHCDAGSAVFHTNRYFSLLERLGPCDAETVYMKIIELIIQFSFKLNENNIKFKEICDDNMHLTVKRLIALGTIDELREWMIGIFKKSIDYINDMNSSCSESCIEKVKKYLNEKYGEKITLDELAKMAHMGRTYFCTFFKQKTGYTYNDYLTMIRIEKAKELLKKQKMKVYEVSAMVGYDDFRHFSKVFKKMEGVNPVRYKGQ